VLSHCAFVSNVMAGYKVVSEAGDKFPGAWSIQGHGKSVGRVARNQ
jgi:hypothetical protein